MNTISRIPVPDPDQHHLPSDHPGTLIKARIGVLVVNLGTPDATDYWSVRRYLNEFLSDKRVIEWPSWLWQPILQGIVLTTRPGKSGKAYQSIWLEETNESPLRKFTRDQAAGLAERFAADGVEVEWAMRYGNPSIQHGIDQLRGRGCTRIVIAALYPQYSAPTTASVHDKVFDAFKALRWQPALRTLPPFFDDPAYISALATSVNTHIAEAGWEPEKLIVSYHGVPKSYFLKGDPYHCHCHKTTRLLREALGWPQERIMTTFQSRFGPAEWLQPYTDKMLEQLPTEGIKRVMVLSPAFISDCLETLEELGEEGEEQFMHAGGEQYALIPCLNASEPALELLHHLIRRELSGWV